MKFDVGNKAQALAWLFAKKSGFRKSGEVLTLQPHTKPNGVLLAKTHLPARFVIGVGLNTQLRLHARALVAEALQEVKGIGQHLIPETIIVVVNVSINTGAS